MRELNPCVNYAAADMLVKVLVFLPFVLKSMETRVVLAIESELCKSLVAILFLFIKLTNQESVFKNASIHFQSFFTTLISILRELKIKMVPLPLDVFLSMLFNKKHFSLLVL